jgi:hypothetical protein
MKRFLTLIVMASLALTIQAQDITNTLSATGHFIIQDNSATPVQLLKITKDARMYIGKGSTGYVGSRTLNLLQTEGSAGLILNSYKGTQFSARSRVSFYTNQGTAGSPTDVVSGDPIGWLDFFGYNGNAWHEGAGIRIAVDGTAAGTHIPMSISFLTSKSGATLTTRMLIKADGTVNITGLAGTGTEFVKVDPNGNLIRSTTKSSPLTPLVEDINRLKTENETLKTEVAELRKMVEMLIEEK